MVPALSIALPKIPDPTLIHIVGVTAVWIIFLSAIRFAAAGVHGLKPVAGCVWHLMRCRCETRPCCRRRLIASLDQQFTELLIAITTPWSVALLFLGMALIGGGLAFGSVGDVAQLVALTPARWSGFDRGMDLVGAILLSAGMAATHAAVTKVRTLSLLISCGFALMGVGIGVVTAVHP